MHKNIFVFKSGKVETIFSKLNSFMIYKFDVMTKITQCCVWIEGFRMNGLQIIMKTQIGQDSWVFGFLD